MPDEPGSDFPLSQDDLPTADRVGAAEAALELLKQLITLASGALAISATFAHQVSLPFPWVLVLPVAWTCLVLAIIAALKAMSAIIKSRLRPEHDWSIGVGKKSASWSRRFFVTGIVFIGIFGSFALFFPSEQNEGSRPYCACPDTARCAGAGS